jgi:phage shock protein A
MRRLMRRARTILQGPLRDVFDEGDAPTSGVTRGADANQDPARAAWQALEALLAGAQARLDALHVSWAEAEARRQRVCAAWRAALGTAGCLDAAADAALAAGDEASARAHLVELKRAQAAAGQLEQLCAACTEVADRLRAALAEQESRLAEARNRCFALIEGDQAATQAEALARSYREADRAEAELQAELRRRQQRLARREDQVLARLALHHDDANGTRGHR